MTNLHTKTTLNKKFGYAESSISPLTKLQKKWKQGNFLWLNITIFSTAKIHTRIQKYNVNMHCRRKGREFDPAKREREQAFSLLGLRVNGKALAHVAAIELQMMSSLKMLNRINSVEHLISCRYIANAMMAQVIFFMCNRYYLI